MKVKKTFRDRSLKRTKNNKAFIGSAAVIAACTVALLLPRWCDRAPESEGPVMPNPPRRADGVCDAANEAFPYMTAEEGSRKLDAEGNPVANPYYSFEDCHDRDGKCDSADNPTDPAGNPVKLVETDAFGRPYTFQGESANPDEPNFSIDCAREQCGNQCGETHDEACPDIERPMIKGDTKLPTRSEGFEETASLYWGLMTEQERAEMLAQAGSSAFQSNPIQPGFWKPRGYEEQCPSKANAELQECGPLTEGPCLCANNVACKPAQPSAKCGDGRITGSEQCDPRSRKARNGCDSGEVCRSCRCVEVEARDVCGDGKITGSEDCDPRSSLQRDGCDEGQKCRRCSCVADVQKKKLEACPSSVTNSSRASKLASEAKRIVRKSGIRGSDGLGASSGASVTVVITNMVSPPGLVSEKGAKALCFGACEKSSLTGGSVKAVTGSLGFDGKTIDGPGGTEACIWTIRVPVASR